MGRMKYGTPESGEVVTQPQTVVQPPVQDDKEHEEKAPSTSTPT